LKESIFMPDLMHALQGNDLGFLRMVAGAWGIELTQPDSYTALQALVKSLNNKSLALEVIETLPTEARSALEALYENQGLLPWQVFTRRFGEVRVMGAARRDRERPDLSPISPAEILWYRALISKAFFNIPPEPQEYAYIPEDLLDFLQPAVKVLNTPLGRPASPGESEFVIPVNDQILDDSCTLLSALRTDTNLPEAETQTWPVPPHLIIELLKSAKLIDHRRAIQTELVRSFLESPRADSLALLAGAWMNSSTYNDLKLLPALKFEGNWRNDPLLTRHTIIDLIKNLPPTWWNINAFISAMHEKYPDFQRPAGDYDSWFIYQESSQSYLSGFASWNEVEGALLRFMINGPLHWLGFLDLATSTEGKNAEAFRPSTWFEALLSGKKPEGLKIEKTTLRITGDGCIHLSTLTPRAIRYQLSRFAQFESHNHDTYIYRLSPKSIERARQQGLKIAQLIGLLRKHATQSIPPGLIQALERWELLGIQSKLETFTALRVTSPEIIALLQQNNSVKRYLGELLNPTTIIIKSSGKDAVFRVLLEAGYLLDTSFE
jgi:hypothetical protein